MPRRSRFVVIGVFSLQAIVVVATLVCLIMSQGTSVALMGIQLTKWLSLIQLLVISCSALTLSVQRYAQTGSLRRCALWILVGIGFFYLACESVWGVNEYIETRIEEIAHVSNTDWTRRIDDGLIGFAGLCGVTTFAVYYREVSRFPYALPMYASGFFVLLLMVMFDVFAAQLDLVMPGFGQTETTRIAYAALELFEDTLMLVGEGLFLVATSLCFENTREPSGGHISPSAAASSSTL